MEVQSSRFGKLQVETENIINFKGEILGFPECKEYVWIHTIEPDLPIECLQCITDEQLAFMIVDPFLFAPDYEFELSQEIKEKLEVASEEQVVVRSILTARPNNNTTLNLKAPIIINSQNRLSAQMILDGSQYQLQYPIGRG